MTTFFAGCALIVIGLFFLNRNTKKCRDCGGHGTFKVDGVPYACSNCQGTGEIK